MFVSGVSTRKIGNVLKELLGFSLSQTTISNMVDIAEEEIEKWRTRKLHREIIQRDKEKTKKYGYGDVSK